MHVFGKTTLFCIPIQNNLRKETILTKPHAWQFCINWFSHWTLSQRTSDWHCRKHALRRPKHRWFVSRDLSRTLSSAGSSWVCCGWHVQPRAGPASGKRALSCRVVVQVRRVEPLAGYRAVHTARPQTHISTSDRT